VKVNQTEIGAMEPTGLVEGGDASQIMARSQQSKGDGSEGITGVEALQKIKRRGRSRTPKGKKPPSTLSRGVESGKKKQVARLGVGGEEFSPLALAPELRVKPLLTHQLVVAVFALIAALLVYSRGGVSKLGGSRLGTAIASAHRADRVSTLAVVDGRWIELNATAGKVFNQLALDAGAIIVEASPVPPVTSGRSGLISRSTSVLALSSKFPPARNECWWLPPPSGSGMMEIKLAKCVRPLYLVVQSLSSVGMEPSRVYIEANAIGEVLGEISWSQEPLKMRSADAEFGQFVEKLSIPSSLSCVDVVRVRVEGKGESQTNGTCIHRLALLGEAVV